MKKVKRAFIYSVYCLIFGLPALLGFGKIYGDGIGAKAPNTKEIARGGRHGGGHHGGHHGHHRHGHHRHHRHGHHHHFHHHHHNPWWHHHYRGWHHHWHDWNNWNYWHHPWHDGYWYGNGYWGANPGYFNDPNYYYNFSGTPSIEYENDENPYLMLPFFNIENTNEDIPFLPQYMDEKGSVYEEGIGALPLFMRGGYQGKNHYQATPRLKNK